MINAINGITPACAGNTATIKNLSAVARDHPRMCGEHLLFMMFTNIIMGSPPHVRGTRVQDREDVCYLRITPACAGNTVDSPGDTAYSRDHPRMCGEHSFSSVIALTCAGSPPHVRGTRRCWTLLRLMLGITPACAGNTIINELQPKAT